MTELSGMVIATAMRKMFEQGWFNICTVDQCLKVAGIIPPKREYEMLRTLHCVHFGEMPRELVDGVQTLLAACFNGMRIDALVRACEPAKLGSNVTTLPARM